MSLKIDIVIGANFGDEGKGLMTDYFCSNFDKSEKVLNIRFNGTCQAGHTVVKRDKRHIFSHFGVRICSKARFLHTKMQKQRRLLKFLSNVIETNCSSLLFMCCKFTKLYPSVALRYRHFRSA